MEHKATERGPLCIRFTAHWPQGLNITQGPLIRVAWRWGRSRLNRLPFTVVHHLICDACGYQLLIEDLGPLV